MKNIQEFRHFVETNLDPTLFIDNQDGGWYQIKSTPFYLGWQGYKKGGLIWFDISHNEYTTFELVLEKSPEEIQERLVFYLDLFR